MLNHATGEDDVHVALQRLADEGQGLADVRHEDPAGAPPERRDASVGISDGPLDLAGLRQFDPLPR